MPAQRRDEAEANWKAARAAADAARALYDMALAGARGEDKEAAAAVVRQAQGAVSEVELRVTTLAPLADFATWRSTSASGGLDLKTFEVRAKPPLPVDGLRPGMSVVVDWGRRAR